MIKNYELMVIISPKLSSDEADAANEAILNLVRENQGEIVKTDPWGKKLLAYPIEKLQEGYYYVNYFSMESTAVKTIGRQLNINEKVLRHLFVAKGE
ncbi:MAG: 30S ribosomal protein S6 [Candidatus Cloacimonetes bacterium]|nr:30S ribosomal protein S6 [Candidatus Cloacimonadota bacterium]NLO11875.1 30S ribosomal protein S6 [Candidatus Cloacimonadota bacterium]